jgi:hypothetical protein
MTPEQACQAQHNKYGNIAYASMLDLKIGDVRTPALRTPEDVNWTVVVVGFTSYAEYKRRNEEFGQECPGDDSWMLYRYYLVRAE